MLQYASANQPLVLQCYIAGDGREEFQNSAIQKDTKVIRSSRCTNIQWILLNVRYLRIVLEISHIYYAIQVRISIIHSNRSENSYQCNIDKRFSMKNASFRCRSQYALYSIARATISKKKNKIVFTLHLKVTIVFGTSLWERSFQSSLLSLLLMLSPSFVVAVGCCCRTSTSMNTFIVFYHRKNP